MSRSRRYLRVDIHVKAMNRRKLERNSSIVGGGFFGHESKANFARYPQLYIIHLVSEYALLATKRAPKEESDKEANNDGRCMFGEERTAEEFLALKVAYAKYDRQFLLQLK